MKRVFHLVLLVLTLLCWGGFVDRGNEVKQLEEKLVEVENLGDPKDEVAGIEDEIVGAKAERLVLGLLLTMFSCGVIGIFIGIYVIPFIAQRATHAIYDSGEVVEQDKMREAHSLLAQGEYEQAIEAFRKVADEDPYNRLPWVEVSKVYRHHLHDPVTAVEVLREAVESHEWRVDDAAFLLFRMAEIYDEDLEDRPTARAIMHQVVDDFPETRHSANANHKLRDWDHEDAEAERHAQEQQFIGRQQPPDSDQDPMS